MGLCATCAEDAKNVVEIGGGQGVCVNIFVSFTAPHTPSFLLRQLVSWLPQSMRSLLSHTHPHR